MDGYLWTTIILASGAAACWGRLWLLQREHADLEQEYARERNNARTYEQDSVWWQRRYETLEAEHVQLKADIRRLLRDGQ